LGYLKKTTLGDYERKPLQASDTRTGLERETEKHLFTAPPMWQEESSKRVVHTTYLVELEVTSQEKGVQTFSFRRQM